MADLIERARSQQESGEAKTLLAAVYDKHKDHYVSVLIRGDQVAILDTRPPRDAYEMGTGEKVEAALRPAGGDDKPVFSAVTTMARDLQSGRFDDDPGLPNGCGLLNLELHRHISALEGELERPRDLVNTFVDEIDNMVPAEKQALNDATRLQIFNSYDVHVSQIKLGTISTRPLIAPAG